MRTAVTFTADDGFSLPGTLHSPPVALRGAVLINAALGVRRGFYSALADWLAERGFLTLTYDYRGVGEARPPRLRGFEATLEDWGRRDFKAAREALRARADGRPLFIVGHSFGGQALGFLPPAEPVAGAWLVASQLGDVRLWRGLARLQVEGFWRLAPPLCRLLGYCPRWAGLGAEVPAGVVTQWARWGLTPGYHAGALPDVAEALAGLSFPVTAAALTDDLTYAPPQAVDALVALMKGAAVRRVDLSPSEGGGGGLGHFGFFRPHHADTLWVRLLADLERWRGVAEHDGRG